MNSGTVLGGIAALLIAGGGAVGAGLLVQRYVPLEQRQENNDVAGLVFAIIGVLYAILLTFVTISVWEGADGAQASSRNEARAVLELRRYATTLPDPERAELRELTERYVDVVVRREWPNMAKGKPVPPEGAGVLEDMWRVVDGRDPADEAGVARQSEARETLRELTTARDERLAAIDAGLPSVIWLALIAGSVIALANALMFGVRGKGEYLAIIAMLAAMSTLVLYAVYQLEYPYERGERVGPTVFQEVVTPST